MSASGREELLVALIVLAGLLLRPPGLDFAPDDSAALVTADQVGYGLRPYEAAPYPKPVFSLAVFALLARLPRSIWTMQCANLVLSLLLQIAVWAAARRLWGRRGGVAAMAVAGALLLTPWAGSVSVVLPAALLAMGAALALTAHTCSQHRWAYMLVGGVLLGLAVSASSDVIIGAVAVVFGAWLWVREKPRYLTPGAFLGTIAAATVAGRLLGGAAYFTCLGRGLDYYLGDVGVRHGMEALLHSVELYLAQPAPLIILGMAGVLALRQAPGQGRAMAPCMALWLVAAVLDANWGRRYEAGAWIPLMPVLAMGAGAFVGVGRKSPEPDRGAPLVLAVALVAVLMLAPRVKVTVGHYRDILRPVPVLSADEEASQAVVKAGGLGATVFVWADTPAAAVHCQARLAPPDPYLVARLAGMWRTTEKVERRETHGWEDFARQFKSAPPEWIVLQTDGDFEVLFPWWSYEPLAAALERDYALFVEAPGRTVYRRR